MKYHLELRNYHSIEIPDRNQMVDRLINNFKTPQGGNIYRLMKISLIEKDSLQLRLCNLDSLQSYQEFSQPNNPLTLATAT